MKPKPDRVIHSLIYYLKKIDDPRSPRGRRYELWQLIGVILYGCFCGYTDCVSIACYISETEPFKFIKSTFKLNKPPSHDTLSRVLRMVNPESLSKALLDWMEQYNFLSGRHGLMPHIALDGKAVRAAARKTIDNKIPYILNAFDVETKQVIRQMQIPEKTNEITGLKEILPFINLEGALVTIDAIGTQKEIVSLITEKKGHYLVPVKCNQKGVLNECIRLFDDRKSFGKKLEKELWIRSAESCSMDHGRYECRKAETVSWGKRRHPEGFETIETVTKVTRIREETKGNKTISSTTEVFYISDLAMEPDEVLRRISGHWEIENGLHWTLDNHWNEDRQKAREGKAIYNCSWLLKFIYNVTRKMATENGCSLSRAIIHLKAKNTKTRNLFSERELPKDYFVIS